MFYVLSQHPWIAASVEDIQSHGGERGSAIIQNLVAEHLPVLTSFREVSVGSPKIAVLEEQAVPRDGHTRAGANLDNFPRAARNENHSWRFYTTRLLLPYIGRK